MAILIIFLKSDEYLTLMRCIAAEFDRVNEIGHGSAPASSSVAVSDVMEICENKHCAYDVRLSMFECDVQLVWANSTRK